MAENASQRMPSRRTWPEMRPCPGIRGIGPISLPQEGQRRSFSEIRVPQRSQNITFPDTLRPTGLFQTDRIRSPMAKSLAELQDLARRVRRDIIEMTGAAKSGHPG